MLSPNGLSELAQRMKEAREELERVTKIENVQFAALLPISTTLYGAAILLGKLVSVSAGQWVFGIGLVLSNIGLILVSQAWRRVEQARLKVHGLLILTVSTQTRAELEFIEAQLARVRKTRLRISVLGLVGFAILDLVFALTCA